MATLEFTTETLSEEKVNWKIKTFTEIQKRKSPNGETTTLEFTAGETLEQSSTWELELTFTKANEIGLSLYLERSYKYGKGVHAQYSASIKGPNSKVIASGRISAREFTTDNGGWGWNKWVTVEELKTGGALINDTLTIEVKLVTYGEQTAKDVTPPCTQKLLKEDSLNHMSGHFKQLLETGEGSDFVIRVRDLDLNEIVEKKVHRHILSSQSPVFAAMLESQMSEKESGVVTIKDFTPKGLDVMLAFIYTGNLPEAWKIVPEEIVNAAEKYQFLLLKTYCDQWLHTACTPDNAISLRNLARQHGLSKAFKNISEYIKSNLDNVLATI